MNSSDLRLCYFASSFQRFYCLSVVQRYGKFPFPPNSPGEPWGLCHKNPNRISRKIYFREFSPPKIPKKCRKNLPKNSPEKNPENKFRKIGGNFRRRGCLFLDKNAVVFGRIVRKSNLYFEIYRGLCRKLIVCIKKRETVKNGVL